jgi:hypothetical protein
MTSMKKTTVITLLLTTSLFLLQCAKGSGVATCGDLTCQSSESPQTCPQDCTQDGCGNGTVEGEEECDGADLDGATCVSLGYSSGSLGCTTACAFNVNFCQSTCNHACETVGDARCDGNRLETCATNAQACRIWELTTDCAAASQVCDDSSGTAGCADSCADACVLDDRRCTVNVLQLCQAGENGCTQWKDQQDCGLSNWICTGTGVTAACTDPCTHDCEAGAPPQCDLTVVQTCGTDGSGCRSWVDGADCAATGQTCTGGACSCVNECTAGDTRCLGTVRQSCTTNGNGCRVWSVVQDCATTGQLCDTSQGSAQCVNTCTDTCASGAVRCLGDVIQNCQTVASGCMDWVDGTNCASTGRSCSGNTCVCNNACSAGQTRCNGSVTQACTQDAYGCYYWFSGTDCAALGQTCSAGACQAPAGGYTCSGLPATYTSIRSTGTALTANTYDDDNRFAFTIPFPYRYYGVNYTGGFLCTNGWASFGADPGTNNYYNGTLPDLALPNAAIFIFWDDLVYDQGTWPDSRLLTQTIGSSPNRVFVLEWYQLRALGSGTSAQATFQIRLYETSNAWEVIYNRATWLGASWSATIGYENADGTLGGDIGTTFTAPPADNYRCVPN